MTHLHGSASVSNTHVTLMVSPHGAAIILWPTWLSGFSVSARSASRVPCGWRGLRILEMIPWQTSKTREYR